MDGTQAVAKEERAIESLRAKCDQPLGGAAEREAAERALRVREATLAAKPTVLDRAAKAKAARAEFDAGLVEAKALSELASAVTVREDMIVVHRTAVGR